MRRFGLFAALLLLAGVLAACTITVTYTPPPSATTVTATGSTLTAHPPAVDSVSVAAGETVYYKVSVPSSIRSGYPLFYAELSQNLNLELMDSGGQPIASAHNSAYFSSGTAGLQSVAAASVAPQGITATLTCNGSCVIVPMTASVYYVAITNESSSSVSVDLYAYGSDYADDQEPGNNTMSTGATLGGNTSYQGALETIGDVDYWYTSSSGYWTFTAPSPDITIVAETVDANGSVIGGPYYSGDRVHVYGGLYVDVHALGGRAGVADASQYTFDQFGTNP